MCVGRPSRRWVSSKPGDWPLGRSLFTIVHSPVAKNHMVFGRIYLSRYTPSFSRSLMVYASTVQAQANRPCPGDPLFTP
jgi:hypothetical protein